jgi:hypothetical protein
MAASAALLVDDVLAKSAIVKGDVVQNCCVE